MVRHTRSSTSLGKRFILLLISTILLTSLLPPIKSNTSLIAAEASLPLRQDPKISTILSMINETLLRTYLETLVSYGPRMTGTKGCEQAATYIHDQFKDMGLMTRYQTWAAWGNRWHPGRFNSQNVEGTLPGAHDRIILFSAHYDSVENTVGADDNGDGTVAVMAAAYVLSQFSFNYTLKFVAFSGEEEGLLGSHDYAKETYENHTDVAVAFNADMIGYATSRENATQVRSYATEDNRWILDLIQELNTTYDLGFTITRGITNEAAGRGGSDYFSFVEYGFETVAFFEKEWNPYMHTPEDSLENVNFSYLVNTTRLIVATMAYLGDYGISHPQIKITSPRFGKWYFNGRERPGFQDLNTLVFHDIWVWADVKPGLAPIQKVEFYYDTTLAFTDTQAPYTWHLNTTSIRKHNITAVVYDLLGYQAHDWKTIRYINLNIKPLLTRNN
ncbi:MAG: M28 family peptidase [Methanobacteriota archaeon]